MEFDDVTALKQELQAEKIRTGMAVKALKEIGERRHVAGCGCCSSLAKGEDHVLARNTLAAIEATRQPSTVLPPDDL